MSSSRFSLKSWKVSKRLGLLLGIILIGGVAAMISLGVSGSPRAEKAAAVPDNAKKPEKPVEKTAAPAPKADRKALAETLQHELANAKTAEEKREILQKFQAKNKAMARENVAVDRGPSNTLHSLAAWKELTKGTLQMRERLSRIETQLKNTEELKAKLAEAQNATGEAKAKLMEEMRLETRKLREAREAEMHLRAQETGSAGTTKEAPPQLAALQARNETRKQAMQQLSEALATASPQERRAIMDDWRKKQMAARKAQMNNPEETNE